MPRFPERHVCALEAGTLTRIQSLLDSEGTVNSFIRRSIRTEIDRLTQTKSTPTPKTQLRKPTPPATMDDFVNQQNAEYARKQPAPVEDEEEDEQPQDNDISKALMTAYNKPAR